MNIQEIIEIIKQTLEKDKRVKICHKFMADTVLQIQLHNKENFNLCIVRLNKKAYIIKRNF